MGWPRAWTRKTGLSQLLKEVKGQTVRITERWFQAEGTAPAKAWRQEPVW